MTGGRAVILGRTGRNFAAGMSGGIAYILDRDGKFQSRCNSQMVELLPVEKEEDLEFLKTTVEQFTEATGSEVGQGLLATWDQSVSLFVKVFPHEYQRALLEQEEEEKEEEKDKVPSLIAPILGPKFNVDIRAAYAIDNTPAVPGMMKNVVLPAESLEADSDSEEDDDAPKPPPVLAPPVRLDSFRDSSALTLN